MRHETRMWQVHDWQGAEVTVIQQWHDPFGTAMVRIGIARGGEVAAMGLPEAEFLRDARLLREDGSEMVEGAR